MGETPKNTCFVCQDDEPTLLHPGCDCKGSNGFVHGPCLKKVVESFKSSVCRTCKKTFAVSYPRIAQYIGVFEFFGSMVGTFVLCFIYLWIHKFIIQCIMVVLWGEYWAWTSWFFGAYLHGILFSSAIFLIQYKRVLLTWRTRRIRFSYVVALYELFIYGPLYVNYLIIQCIWTNARDARAEVIVAYGEYGVALKDSQVVSPNPPNDLHRH